MRLSVCSHNSNVFNLNAAKLRILPETTNFFGKKLLIRKADFLADSTENAYLFSLID